MKRVEAVWRPEGGLLPRQSGGSGDNAEEASDPPPGGEEDAGAVPPNPETETAYWQYVDALVAIKSSFAAKDAAGGASGDPEAEEGKENAAENDAAAEAEPLASSRGADDTRRARA